MSTHPRTLFRLLLILSGIASPCAFAEPYLAVQQGLKCVQCHVNPTGGGLRNAYGNAFSLAQMSANRIDVPPDSAWLGKISEVLALGANVRAAATATEIPNQEEDSRAFELRQARLYLNVAAIPNRLEVYVDQLLAPGAAINREAYVRYSSAGGNWYAKAGQMYLPYGLRLQDDSAFVRQGTGINMTTPDSGVEVGWEHGGWSSQLALTNGSAGGPESNTGKQYSLQSSWTQKRWRIGAGINLNDSDDADRRAATLFGGLRTGPIAWLAEADYVVDQVPGGADRKRVVGLFESNWRVKQGHNLKFTFESLDPNRDIDEDDQDRFSFVYEYTPVQFLQLRGGARFYEGIPQNDLQNRRVYFLELHGFY